MIFSLNTKEWDINKEGVTMFEKDAEEILNKHCNCEFLSECIDGIRIRCFDYKENKNLLLEGIEFGYNKANEWHYVKDGDLPKENQLVLLYRENPNGANVALTYWYKSYVNDKVIAWKEVIPPKELDE